MKKCAKTVYGRRGLVSWPCGRTAKVQREGKWYCGTHDPERLKNRRERYQAAFDIEALERKTMRDAEQKIEELGRKVHKISAQYDIIDAARERLRKAIEARRKVR